MEVLPSGKVCNNFFSFVSFAVILTDSLTDLSPDTHSSLHLLNTWRPLGSSSSQGPRSKWVQGMLFGSLETQFATEVSQASSSSNRMLHPVAAAAADLVGAAGTDKREDFSFGFLGTPQSFQRS